MVTSLVSSHRSTPSSVPRNMTGGRWLRVSGILGFSSAAYCIVTGILWALEMVAGKTPNSLPAPPPHHDMHVNN